MPLPRLVQEFAAPGCFTLDEAVAVTGKARGAIKKEIEYLQARGYLESVRRGLYALDPGKSFGPDPDPFVLASKVTQPYLLSHHAALSLHGVAESAFFREVTIATPKRFKPFTWREYGFRAVSTPDWILGAGRATAKRAGATIAVASRELTLVQCAQRPELAGGFAEVVASIRGFPFVDWGALLDLLASIDKAVLYRKVGYLVAINADRWRPPEAVLRDLKTRLGAGTTYLGVRPGRGGRHEREWQVIVPRDAPEVSALA